MSDLSAAAAALGIPEAIVMRSATARAAETGMSIDEVLAAWAAGGSIDAPPPTSGGEEPTEPPSTEAADTLEEPQVAPTSAGETPTSPPAPQGDITPPPPSRAAPSGKPPVLVGEPDRPMTVMAGIVGLFVAVLLVGLVGPSVATENPGARTSALSYSEAGLQGQKVYENLGCGSCHTQMVRPIVSDVGLGAVTLNDSNQVLGTRRFGPDLSDVGNRLTGTQIEAIVTGLDDHPRAVLSGSDLENLATYLLQSSTAVPQEEEAPVEAEEEPAGDDAEAGAQP
jgi:hypothetical protein